MWGMEGEELKPGAERQKAILRNDTERWLKPRIRNFSSGPVVKIPWSTAWGLGSVLSWETKTPYATQPAKKLKVNFTKVAYIKKKKN